jgi:creatinine amidohydrolase/Fe(II)-dependent formamide hydrolase-like protein
MLLAPRSSPACMMPKGYFGDPAAASREEGEATIAALGEILAEAVLETMLRP